MKGNVVRGDGFRGVLDYALGDGKRAEIVGGNLSGRNARELSAEFAAGRRLRPDARNPVWHTSLSLPPGEKVDWATWDRIAHGLMQKVGMDPSTHQFVVVVHGDTHCQHVHVVASRIGLDGKLWHGKWEAKAVHRATAELEREFGLTITKGAELVDEARNDGIEVIDNDNTETASPPPIRMSRKEEMMWRERDEVPPKMRVAQAIDDALAAGDGTLDDLVSRIEEVGIEVRVNRASTGRVSGLSFQCGTDTAGAPVWLGGRDVGKDYGWARLEKRLESRRAVLVAQPTAPAVNLDNQLSTFPPPASGAPGGSPADDRREERRRGDGVCGIACADPEDRKKQFKARLFAQQYRTLPAELAGFLHFVKVPQSPGNVVEIGLTDGQRITDMGDRITLKGDVTDQAVAVMATAAAGHGWASVTLTGNAVFKQKAWLAMQRMGVAVEGYTPPAEVVAAWEAEQHEQQQGRVAEAGRGGELERADVAGFHRDADRDRDVDRPLAERHRGPTAGGGEPVSASAAGVGRPGSGFGGPAESRRDDTPARSARPDSARAAMDRGCPADRRDDGAEHVEPDATTIDRSEVGGGPGSSGGRRTGGGRGGAGWDARFRKASAARRREREGSGPGGADQRAMGDGTDGGGSRISDEVVARARQVDPRPFIEAAGYSVISNRRGDRAEVPKVMRLDLVNDRWVACEQDETGIGDTIAIVRWLNPELSFREAVERLLGAAPTERIAPVMPVGDRRPEMPEAGRNAASEGRSYLLRRGFSQEAIAMAERHKVLTYVDDAVVFVGRDRDDVVRSAYARWIDGRRNAKTDVSGTDKFFAPVFPGDRKRVVVVESGTNMLAVYDLATRRRQPVPTIIVSGGSGVRKFLHNPGVALRIKEAEQVEVWGEWEKDQATQEKTDAAHRRQVEQVNELRGDTVAVLRHPPKTVEGRQIKDLADWAQIETQRERKNAPPEPVSSPPAWMAKPSVSPEEQETRDLARLVREIIHAEKKGDTTLDTVAMRGELALRAGLLVDPKQQKDVENILWKWTQGSVAAVDLWKSTLRTHDQAAQRRLLVFEDEPVPTSDPDPTLPKLG